ncbi:response regulator transcription factor [Sporosarcina sp. CAU 1771]
MYRLMIVEDEPWIAKGLEVALPWEKFGIQLIGSVGNGAEALKVIDDTPPDIIITDIMMPVMGGMELLNKLSEKMEPMPEVIIISGYNDFKYLQQAIRHGIADYLLKPIEPSDLEKIITTLVQKMNIQKKNQFHIQKILVENTLYESLSLEENREPDFKLPFPIFKILFSIEPIHLEMLRSLSYVSDWYVLPHLNHHIYLFAFQTNVHADLFTKFEYSKIQGRLSVGISSKYYTNDFEFYDAYKEAESNFQHNYNEFHTHNDMQLGPARLNRELEQQWIQLLQDGNKEKVYYMMEQNLNDYSAFEQRWSLVFQFYLFLSKYSPQSNLKSVDWLFELKKIRNDRDLTMALETMIVPLLESISAEWQGKVSNLSREAVNFIEQHYDNPLLSLLEVAERLGISAAYLSVIFKNEVGMNYIHFVTRKRVEIAKKALLETKKTINEISSICGFNDVKYFIKVFKKEIGFTPNKFRGIHSLIK